MDNDKQQLEIQSGYRFAVIPEWILYDVNIDPLDKVVYAVLDRFNGAACFPSLRTIGEKVNRDERSVRRSIHRLEEIGAIRVKNRFKGGRQTSNLYQLAGDKPFEVAPVTDVRGDPDKFVRGDPDTDVRAEPEKERTREEGKATYRRAVQLPPDMGSDPDRRPVESKLTPSREIVNIFLTEWSALVPDNPNLFNVQVIPHRVAAYKWLNTQYFKPEIGEPKDVDYVAHLVHNFMRMIKYRDIEPKPGMTAWQCFIYNIKKLSENNLTSTYVYEPFQNDGYIEPTW